ATYAARGRRQPYAADAGQQADQVSSATTQKTQHTFGQANNPGPASGRYDWLVHLDREPVSAADVLHASGCQPHQLTQRFLLGDGSTPGQRFQHYARWFDQTRRLYRAFEFFTTHGRGAGAPNEPGGRVAGKVNLNAVWDAETFLALCDPSSANGPNL